MILTAISGSKNLDSSFVAVASAMERINNRLDQETAKARMNVTMRMASALFNSATT